MKKILEVIEERPGLFAISTSLLLHITLFTISHMSSPSKTIHFSGKALSVKLTTAPLVHATQSTGSSKTAGDNKSSLKANSKKLKKVASLERKGAIRGKGSSSSVDKRVYDILNEFSKGEGKGTPSSLFGYSAGAEIVGKGGEDAISETLWSHYAEKVWKIIRANWIPPPGGGKTAVVLAVIDENGRLVNAELQQSSGNRAFDARALEAVKKASPFPPPPIRERVEIAFRFLRE